MKSISYLINFVAGIQLRFCSWSMVVLGLAMTVIILIQIFFRFVIYRPVPWSEEAARYLMIWMGMLGSVVALRKGRHIGVTFLVDKLSGWARQAAVQVVRLTMIGFMAIIGWEGLGLAIFNAPQLSAAMEIPMTIPYLAIPVGSAMMIVDIIAEILEERFPTAKGSEAQTAASFDLDSEATALHEEE
ncbi:MAG: TRAP transporter small permease [Deltaproteobacteria bacterium]|nr:TRAP transporter small permease [Deltaproteobacteria bacterium]